MDSKDRIIQEQQSLIAQLRALVADLQSQVAQQAARIAQLELQLAKAKKDSSTSSKPPSSDFIRPKSKAKKPGRRKKNRPGGQHGHERRLREPLPIERVNKVVDLQFDDEKIEQLHLAATGHVEVIQHIELPEFPVFVTEYRLAEYQDAHGNLHYPNCPSLKGPIFGPKLLATIGWLKSVGHCSYSTIESWMQQVLNVPVSRGYLSKLCNKTISESLAESYNELTQAIADQPQLGSDETGIKNNGNKHWIWCITAPIFTVFHIAATRSRAVLEKLVGPTFAGYLNFDYFSSNCSFAWNHSIKAQYCWAHLIRDIRFLEKHPDQQTQDWAKQLLARTKRMFSAWHGRDTMTDDGFHRSMITHRNRFLELVRHPPSTNEAENLSARFSMVEYTTEDSPDVKTYDRSQDYFRFMFADGVEPTNNHSEQQIRHCVIDRKITQGTRSEAGQRYHERMWTAIATCQKQGRNFFEYLQESIHAHLQNQPTPSLLNA